MKIECMWSNDGKFDDFGKTLDKDKGEPVTSEDEMETAATDSDEGST